MSKEAAFAMYLLEEMGQEFDESNVDHLTWQAVFFAGWEAKELG